MFMLLFSIDNLLCNELFKMYNNNNNNNNNTIIIILMNYSIISKIELKEVQHHK